MLNLRHYDIEDELNSGLSEGLKQIQSLPPIILYSVIGFIVLIIFICIYVQYKRYRTRQAYNQTPEHFTHKPDLNILQNFRLNNVDMIALSPQEAQTITKRQNYEGVYYEIVFHSNENCVYFNNLLKDNAYFEIEIIQLSSIVEIGFIHKDEINEVFKMEDDKISIELDRLGLSVNTDGNVVMYGENKFPYRWSLDYGDMIGLGITSNNNEKRGWVTKNGVILNPPNREEMLKNIDLSKEQAQEKGDFQKEKKAEGDAEEEDKNYQKKKLQFKSTKKFKYYPVIVSQRGFGEQPTIINVNVGGQIFRMFDKDLQGGILV